MTPDQINIGDKLYVNTEFFPGKSGRVIVTIISKTKGSADMGYVFHTLPVIGSGFGLCAGWFEPIDASRYRRRWVQSSVCRSVDLAANKGNL